MRKAFNPIKVFIKDFNDSREAEIEKLRNDLRRYKAAAARVRKLEPYNSGYIANATGGHIHIGPVHQVSDVLAALRLRK